MPQDYRSPFFPPRYELQGVGDPSQSYDDWGGDQQGYEASGGSWEPKGPMSQEPVEELSQAEVLRLQRLQQGKSSVQEQLDSGILLPHEGQQLLGQINQGMIPLQKRKVMAMNQQRQLVRQTMLDEAANGQAVDQMNAEFRAKNIEKRVAVVNDPITGRVAHLFEQEPNRWAQVEWPEQQKDENAPDWQPLGGGPGIGGMASAAAAPYAMGQAAPGDGGWDAAAVENEQPPSELQQQMAAESARPPQQYGGNALRAQAGLPPEEEDWQATGGLWDQPEAPRAPAWAEWDQGAAVPQPRAHAGPWAGEEAAPGQAQAGLTPADWEEFNRRRGISTAPTGGPARQPETRSVTRRVQDNRAAIPGPNGQLVRNPNYGKLVEETVQLPVDPQTNEAYEPSLSNPPRAREMAAAAQREERRQANEPRTREFRALLPEPWMRTPEGRRTNLNQRTRELESMFPDATPAQRSRLRVHAFDQQQREFNIAATAANRSMQEAQHRAGINETVRLRGGGSYNRAVITPQRLDAINEQIDQQMTREATRPTNEGAAARWTEPSWARGGPTSQAWQDRHNDLRLIRMSRVPGALDEAGMAQVQRILSGDQAAQSLEGTLAQLGRVVGGQPAATQQPTQPQQPPPVTQQPQQQRRDLRDVPQEQWTPAQRQAIDEFSNLERQGANRDVVDHLRRDFQRYGSVDAMPGPVRQRYETLVRQIHQRRRQGGRSNIVDFMATGGTM